MRRTQRIIGYQRNGVPIWEIMGGDRSNDDPPNVEDMSLEELRTRDSEITERMTVIHDEAGDEQLSDEAADEWSRLHTEQGEVREQTQVLERAERQAERRERARANRERYGVQIGGGHVDPFDGSDVTRLSRPELRERALRVLDHDDHNGHLTDRQREHMDQLVRRRTRNCDGLHISRRLIVTQHPDYRSAFQKLVTRTAPVLTPEESRAVQQWEEYRAMALDPDSAGGFGVPVLIDPTVILTAQGHPNDFFGLARVEVITTDEWRGVTSAGVSWSFDAEAAEVSDDSPTLAGPTVPSHKAQGLIEYSIEVGMDYPGFADEMSTLLSEGYSELLVSSFTTGTGTAQPTGIITALASTASEVDTAATGAIDADDVNGLWAALPIRYRSPVARTAWMGHTSTNNVIGRLGAGNDLSAFTVDFTAEGVMVLKGRPFSLNDYFAELDGAASGLLVVGDWRNYLIAQRAGMSIELVPHLFHTANNRPSGERAWYAWARVGADSVNDAGFRMLSDDGA